MYLGSISTKNIIAKYCMICALFYAPIRRSLKALKRKKDRVFRSYIENISFIHIYNVKFAISPICT